MGLPDSKELLDYILRQIQTVFIHHLLSDGQRALMNTQHLRPAVLVMRQSVIQPHDVHGAVADIRHHDGTHEFLEAVVLLIHVHHGHHRRIALRENAALDKVQLIADIVKLKLHILIVQHVFAVRIALADGPRRRKADGEIDVRFRDILCPKFSGNRSQREDVEVLVSRLVRVECLVAFTDSVPPAIVVQDITVKVGFGVHRRQTGRKDGVRRLHVAIAGIHANDDKVIVDSHKYLHKPS